MKKRNLVVTVLSIVGISGAAGFTTLASAATVTPTAPTVSSVSQQPVAETSKETSDNPAKGGLNTEAKTSPEADGPGGHQDVSGANTNHQFDGQE